MRFSFTTYCILQALAFAPLFMSADEVPKTTLTGTLGVNSKKATILTCPTFAKVGDEEVQVGSHDWTLAFPRAYVMSEALQGKEVQAAGYWCEDGRFFAVELTAKGEAKTAKKDSRKKADLYGDEEAKKEKD